MGIDTGCSFIGGNVRRCSFVGSNIVGSACSGVKGDGGVGLSLFLG